MGFSNIYILIIIMIVIIIITIIIIIIKIIMVIIIRRPIAVARARGTSQTSEPQAASFHSANPPIHQPTPLHQSNPSTNPLHQPTSPPIHHPTSPLGPEVSEA